MIIVFKALYEEEFITTTSEGYEDEESTEFDYAYLFDKRSAPDYTEPDKTTLGRNQSLTYEFIEKINSTTFLTFVSRNITNF